MYITYKKYIILVRVFIIILIGIVILISQIPKKENASFTYVKSEFYKIQQLKNSVFYDSIISKKYLYAMIGVYYKTDLTEEEVINYYNKELQKYDWKFIKKKSEKDLYGVFPGNTYYYKKDPDSEYKLSIFFPSREFFGGEEKTYNFELVISKN